MNDFYILINKQIQTATMMEWAQWMASPNRNRVKSSTLEVSLGGKRVGEIRISTVFLGLDHSFTPGAEPILFETMIFGGALDQEMDRCCTYEAAIKMHELMIERVKNQ